jgi:predicted ATPase/DNA-binding SARP family transcriptional activator/DNA-binding CsgD family transcriptional regulator
VGSRIIEDKRWRLRKAAALVKLLALAPGHRLHRERAMDLLWPDLGKKAVSNNLRQALYAARRIFAGDRELSARYLASEEESLVLCPGGQLWVDVEAFEEATATARRSRDPAAYRGALDLYAGELLPDDRYEEWAHDWREQLRAEHLELLVELAGVYEERGEYGAAIQARRRVVGEEPMNEEARADLMRAYVLSGRPLEALAQYERLRETLSGRLGTEPGATIRGLRDEIAAGRLPLTPPADLPQQELPHTRKHNLPGARTSFIGRERELVEIKRTLAITGLMTLTGAGGSGKTRLALEIARGLVGVYPDGVWLVELGSLSEGELVAQAVADALGVREQPNRPLADTLADALREKKLLLLLDNCEHLLDAAARLVDTLLGSCPRLRILATGREAIGVPGEANWPVPPLSVPDADSSPTDLMRYEAVRLFVERARLRLPSFDLTPANAQAVAEVCRRLDGIPLAIELVTGRVTALAIQQVAERIEDSLSLLISGPRAATPRHQTMRATIEWSFALLSEPEQALFNRLSVFVGGCTLEAAETVGAGDGLQKGDVLDLLGRLVDKSLLVAEPGPDSASRYRMLEPVREYAREKLEESGEDDAVRHRHLLWCLTLAEQAEPELKGPRQKKWLEWLEREHDNLQVALGWVLEREVETPESIELGARLASALWRFWYKRGHLSTGHRWLDATLSKSGVLSAVTRVKALGGAGLVAWERGDYASARAIHEEGLRLHRQAENKPGIAFSLNHLGLVALYQGDYRSAKGLLEEGLILQQELEDAGGKAAALHNLGLVALYRGDYEPAKTLIEESLSLVRDLGDIWTISILLNNLGLAALHQGDYDRAADLQEESLTLRRELGDRGGVAECLEGLSGVAGARASRAVRLWASAEAIREEIGAPLPPGHRSLHATYLTAARSQLDDAAFAEAWATGKAITQEAAIEYALGAAESTLPTVSLPQESSSGKRTSPLTGREEQVALLVARGLTDRQISSEFAISERTVTTHLSRILKKLKLNSRTQLAAWITEQQLRR